MTTKKTIAAAAEASAEAVTLASTAEAKTEQATIVGPALSADSEPKIVVLSHHLCIDGTDYSPGAELLVSSDYADRLRAQGYVSRT
ncbi:hypothetical protein ACFZC6_08140 [Streptomyces ossamyceticus]|uniref:hypothetical protein n=1 Tax=Streptomyces ossamyceticus TaxID=249581 RepID=UPI0036E5624A